MNDELVKYLKIIKKSLVKKELTGQEWEERQDILMKLEDAVVYLNDCTSKGVEFD